MTREKEIDAVKDEIVQHLRRNMGSHTACALVAKLDALQPPLPTRHELGVWSADTDDCGGEYLTPEEMKLAGHYWLTWVANQLAQGCYADLTAGRRDTLMRKHADELEGRR